MDIRPAPALLQRLQPKRLFQVTGLGLTAVLVSVTLLYCVLFWKLWFVDTPRYICSGQDCPRGMGWLAVLIPLLGTAAGLLWAGIKGAPLVRRSPFARALAITLALVALWPGWSAYTWMRGPQMDLFGWQSPVPPAAQPIGVWASERAGVLVRARPDGLVAYDGEGRKGWRLPASEQTPVCALSRTTPSDVGLVAYQEGGRCGTRIEAVDLAEGRSLWDRDLKPSRAHTVVAAAGTTAVVAEEGALVGLDLRGGEERWRVPSRPSARSRPSTAPGTGPCTWSSAAVRRRRPGSRPSTRGRAPAPGRPRCRRRAGCARSGCCPPGRSPST
ncbi:PQQ-binding-like beta-propeller repeat protein [Streptomyces sp. MS1.HAVA.3]|uniref:PQQ-binding-like beta-propeller repeat protein n=1 Tax=Streptomyces caledonius TaxID=3134107 RepID=A0ABU8U9C8_9ACTN